MGCLFIIVNVRDGSDEVCSVGFNIGHWAQDPFL